MKDFTIVCPADINLISRLNDHQLVLSMNSLTNINEIYQASTHQNSVQCLKVRINDSLTSLEINEELKSYPLALYVNQLGDFKKTLDMIPVLRTANLKIFLPAHIKENMKDIRILSSLNVYCGLFFESKGNINWDMINDLMSYSVYGQTTHSPIEPFTSVINHYVPHEFTYFNSCYFENPIQYLYINENEDIALSKTDLENKKFIAQGLASINHLKESSTYQEELNKWHTYFLENRKCSSCPAWRICQGNFLEQCQKNEECYQFFSDLLEAADFYYLQKNKSEKWQS